MFVNIFNNFFKRTLVVFKPFFKEGEMKLHSRYYRKNRDDMFKIMDDKKFKDLMKETSILSEEEFFKLADSEFSNFFFPKFDKDYFIFMFHVTITDSNLFFKQRLSPSLSIYKANIYSFISIANRVVGIFLAVPFLLFFFLGANDFETVSSFFSSFLSFLYDDEAKQNFLKVHSFVFVHLLLFFILYHIIQSLHFFFPFSLKTNIISLLKSFFFLFFSILCFNFVFTTLYSLGGFFSINLALSYFYTINDFLNCFFMEPFFDFFKKDSINFNKSVPDFSEKIFSLECNINKDQKLDPFSASLKLLNL